MQIEETDFLMDYIINQKGGDKLTTADLHKVISCFESRLFFNKDIVLHRGEVCNRIGIVFSGLFKTMTASTTNLKLISDLTFAPYNIVLVDGDSFISGCPALANIVSIDESVVLYISENNFCRLCIEVPTFNAIGRNMMNSRLHGQNLMAGDYKNLDSLVSRTKFKTDNPLVYTQLTLKEMGVFLGFSKNTYKN